MAYVGNTPADKTLTLEKQQFSVSATPSYTLDHSVSDPQDIGLFINNVRQNPNSSYTVSGTALTLSAATASTDTMYCVFLGRAIGTIGIAAGSVTKDKVDFISDGTGSGVISKGDGSSIDGSIQLNCHVNSHGIKLKSPPHSAGASYTLTFPNSISADKFLKTDGSGNLSFASAGDYSLISTSTISSNVSTVDFTNVFSSSDGFQSYTLVGDTVRPANNNTGFRLRFKNSSGTISSSYYVWQVGGGEVSSGSQNFTQSNGAWNDQEFDFVGPAGGNPGNSTTFGGTNFIVEVFNPTDARYTNVLWRYTHVRSDEATVHNVIGAGVLRTTDAITGLNLFFVSGDIAEGSLSLYGRK